MKVYPVIYSRTKFCDYVSGFLVRPYDFDSIAASKYVSVALNEVKHTDGIRHAVFSVGDYIIYGGTACITTSLIQYILKEKNVEKIDLDYQEYQSDNAERPLTFFIGFAIKKSETNDVYLPSIDLYNTYKIFLNHLKKQWLNITTQTEVIQESDYIDITSTEYKSSFVPQLSKKYGLNIIENYSEEKYQDIINYYFHQIIKNPTSDYSFLSNVLPDMVSSTLLFKNISIYGINSGDFTYSNFKLPESNISKSKQDDDLSPKIFYSTSDYNSNSKSSIKNTKMDNTDGLTIYYNTDQYTQKHGHIDGKKTIPTSRKLLIAIIVALLVGGIIMTNALSHAETHTTSTHREENYQTKIHY